MKTAEEVAAHAIDEMQIQYDDNDLRQRDILYLVQALTVFAEERVKEIQGEDVWKVIHRQRDRARTEALEEAANICIKNAEGLGCADEFYTDPDHDKVALAKAMLKAAALEIMDKIERKT